MKKVLLNTSLVIAGVIAFAFIATSVYSVSDTVLGGGNAASQPKLSASIDEDSVCFDTNDIDSLRPSLDVVYTNQYGQRVSVVGYSLSASVQNGICTVYVMYNGLTTGVKFNVNQL